MNARKRPIPTANAIFRDSGIAFASQLRIRSAVRTVKRIPETKIAPNAVCQE
jgi:hypothetical protein